MKISFIKFFGFNNHGSTIKEEEEEEEESD